MTSKKQANLIEPTPEMRNEFRAMAEEFRAAGDDRCKAALADFSAYLERVSNYARDVDLPPDRVPENEFWLVCEGKIIGRSRLRHRLTPALEREGGHIGYDVRPSARRRGYGTLILRLTLEKAADLGLEEALVTCDTDNTGSAKIIEKNGGRLVEHGVSEKTGKQISRYRIKIAG